MAYPIDDPRIKHLVVLMMENRSFDHMMGLLKTENPELRGVTPGSYHESQYGRHSRAADRRCRVPRAAARRSGARLFRRLPADVRHPVQRRLRANADHGRVREKLRTADRRRRWRRRHEVLPSGAPAGLDDAGAGVRGLRPVVLIRAGTDAAQPRLCPLRDLVRTARHVARLLSRPAEHLSTAEARRKEEAGSITTRSGAARRA